MTTDLRARYLNQRVMTATPGQRVVMLYDRLHVDLGRAAEVARQGAQSGRQGRQPDLEPAVPAMQQGPLPDGAVVDSLASAAVTRAAVGEHIDHAMQVVAELAGSLNATAGGPAESLASLYGFLLAELSAIRSGQLEKLAGAQEIVAQLRSAWTEAVASTAAPAAAGAWVG